MAQTATTSNPLVSGVGTLASIFQNVSDSYFGFKQRVEALKYLEAQTEKDSAAYTPQSDKSTQAAPAVDMKNVAIGAAALVVAGIVLARLLK